MIKDRFNKKSNVKKVLNRMSDFQELQEDYSYAYGDVISLFFKERIKESDYSLEVFQEVFPYRDELFNPEVLDRFDINPKKYVKLYKKDIELLKKQSN